nr:G-type lectin S-receptor-like serine/threonine-protein kinase LECRK2 [Ziziphus jujuba var. spinosa]
MRSSTTYLSMTSNFLVTLLLLLAVLFTSEAAQQPCSPMQIKPRSKISPKSDPNSWSSLSSKFKFGFYEQGDGFAIGIWLVGGDDITVVWTANRDDPPITSSNATLSLDENGKLLLRTNDGQKEKIIVNTTYSATSASMLDSGNFVLCNRSGHVIWESFQNPTDTLLGGQVLHSGHQLFSSLSETDRSTGRFRLKMQVDGNLVLYPLNSDDVGGDAYWSSNTNDGNFHYNLYVNTAGELSIGNGSYFRSSLYSSSEDNQNGTIYLATIDANGIFKLYSHAPDKDGKLKKHDLMWPALKNPCEVKGFCGLNSFCTFFDDQPNCVCLPGSDYIDVDKKTLGCLNNHSDGGCIGGKGNVTHYNIAQMENIIWPDFGYMEASMSMEECNNSCLTDCNCWAALFKKDANGKDVCTKQKLPLRYVRRNDSQEDPTTAFFKVDTYKTTRNDSTDKHSRDDALSKNDLMKILVLVFGMVIFSCVSIAISCLYIFKIRVLRYKRLRQSKGQFVSADEELTLRAFSYNELKKATNNFKEELGKGSFGAVYRGALNKGRKLIAVKRLEKFIEEGEREFLAEMQAISRTNHKNLVRLMGYCAEDSKRLLVYEYMSNGSLADLLFKNANRPYWEERVRIAIDVAKGIHYLHEECKTTIIHCDVKPQNILMDDFWIAKISDFGLAKLLMPDQTRTFTGIRGTRGYLAPEWQQNTPITVKADIYSYGIVLLEIICCRRNLEVNVPNTEEIVLSNWVYKCFAGRELGKLVVGQDVDRRTLEKMVKVGLWCIQDEPVLRPSMKSVVLMLEGIIDISAPPCPTSSSM